ncbi:unnamed protein product [Rotaria sp. Silwood2]|nr:unnamed protein product [Rotaria sp. Silwood2]CAF2754008.1 unnamed protein product [Rotaria sp. Silwood2]CAF3146586.1 unnamed protein product [Rotaria sp. Silwood2]CAF3861790.1 unnamed protein product [Rotaria sp. Silwood2]CAF3981757.1 unnamed protein product [Rotaria sp. Silwood2]
MLSEQVNGNNVPRKWWHHRWFTIICICFVVVAILGVILTLVLKFAILAPKKRDITTATSPSSTETPSPPSSTGTPSSPSSTGTPSSPSSTGTLSSPTATTASTTATTTLLATAGTTTQQSGTLYTDAF